MMRGVGTTESCPVANSWVVETPAGRLALPSLNSRSLRQAQGRLFDSVAAATSLRITPE
jgi:hypothetical protein